uniref:Sodium/potassium-transporting ATPase subunit beta-1-interacting protein n=1 Tax=Caenorhabditis tropicalis TaxID=1561998 RepID=A0A1I7V154_9PELO
MSVRWLLSLLLATWTLLSIARLVFDLIGNLWVVVSFDFVQIVFLISGLFGATQKRRPLIYTFLISNALSITINILIFLWYIGVFGEISRPYLSAGLPYSSSFFLRFTPGCDAEFDVIRKNGCKKLVWCHSTPSKLLIEIRKKPVATSQANINHYAQISATKVAKPPSTTANSSSGYLNSQYDDLASTRESKKEVKGQFERKKKKKKPSMPAPDCAPCSRSSEEDVYTKPIKKRREVIEEPTVTSLVSFDPKSATLLRIRQHLEAEPSDRDVGLGLYLGN